MNIISTGLVAAGLCKLQPEFFSGMSNTEQLTNQSLMFQWFGNIVTMDWWDDLWLNEGFASFMEYLGANVTKPSWEMVWQYTYNERILLGYLYHS